MAEQVHRKVALSRPHQHARHDAPPIEGTNIAVLRVFIPRSAGHVRDQLLTHRHLGPALELGKRERQLLANPRQPAKIDYKLIVAKVRHGSTYTPWAVTHIGSAQNR